MNLMFDKILILKIFMFNLALVFCDFDNTELSRGDQCQLDNNQFGICEEVKNCEYAIKLIKERRNEEISRCNFEGKISIVCCPEDKLATISTTQVTTTQASTTNALKNEELNLNPKPVPTYPKSKKFLSALCKDNSTITPTTINIFDGEAAEVGEFPFQVALGYRKQRKKIDYECGGSLIADDIVLTAAHCVNRKNAIPVTVKLGRVSLVPDEHDYGDGEDIDILSIKIHPKYSRLSRHNDIALIKLKQPTKFTWPIETICLSSNDTDLPKNFTISGFGENDVDKKKKSNWLLKAIVNIHPFLECKELIKYGGKDLVETQFCAIGYKGADTCQGDSGGPVSYKITGIPYLYGIVSYGMNCGGNTPGIYTKVNQFLEWIDDEMYNFEQNFIV